MCMGMGMCMRHLRHRPHRAAEEHARRAATVARDVGGAVGGLRGQRGARALVRVVDQPRVARDHHVLARLEADVARGVGGDTSVRVASPFGRVVGAAAQLEQRELTGGRGWVEGVPRAMGVGVVAAVAA